MEIVWIAQKFTNESTLQADTTSTNTKAAFQLSHHLVLGEAARMIQYTYSLVVLDGIYQTECHHF